MAKVHEEVLVITVSKLVKDDADVQSVVGEDIQTQLAEVAEHLIRLKLKDGSLIDFHRTANNEVHICHKDHCVILPGASGRVTMDLFALLEPFGEIEEEIDEKA